LSDGNIIVILCIVLPSYFKDTLDPDELAMRIEDKLYEHYKGTNEKYRVDLLFIAPHISLKILGFRQITNL
jgi:hypothetical protein